MLQKFSFWISGTIFFQILTGLVHAASFFVEQKPANETEKQLMDLMKNYQREMGAGFHPSMYDIFISVSACFTALCLMTGIMNWYLWRKKISSSVWRGLVLIQFLFFGALFMIMLRFAFLPPVVLTGLIAFCSGCAFLSANHER